MILAGGLRGGSGRLSAVKHGFFCRGLMLCDRCVLCARCEFSVPSDECAVEKKAYEYVASELVSQYGLSGLADEILVERVAMYLIRIARAEVYEANVGVSSASAAWGKYIAGLDGVLRVLLRELALTRAERKKWRRAMPLLMLISYWFTWLENQGLSLELSEGVLSRVRC
jgi:hypothetical protein